METIERIRNATFTLTRRGYDRHEVDSYLSKLADWLEGGGANQAHGQTVRQELERVGKHTSKILTAAEDAARGLHADAEQEARQFKEGARSSVEKIRSSADDYARKTREDADSHANKVRGEADKTASATVKAAEENAIRIVEEGAARRRQMEKVIADLQSRREAIVNGLEKLSRQLAGAASQGKEMSRPAEPVSGSRLSNEEVRRQVRESEPSAPRGNSISNQSADSSRAPTRQ